MALARAGLFALVLAAIPPPAVAGPTRPGWEKVKGGVRLPSRDVLADRSMPLPQPGEAFYVFTRQALDRATIDRASARGLRYLGAAASMTYVFRREDAREGQRAFLSAEKELLGTAAMEPADRLEAELLPHFAQRGAKGATPLPHKLWVTFWRKTTAREALQLLPEAAELLRLPRSLDAALEEECLVKLSSPSDRARLARLAASPFVAAIGLLHPKKLHNADSRAMANADAITAAPYGLDGSGVLVGHWDGGSVSSGHADFQQRVTNLENQGVSDHATHTAGTILGAGVRDSAARGFAPGATMIAYDFYGDPGGERRAAKHEHYHEHDNHSWGSTSASYGGYDEGAREFDFDSRDVFLIGLKAAGNEGQNSQVVDNNYGFDSLPPDSTSKNVLIVCAVDDDGDLAGFSSRGPTNDGRMKPDICANGVNLYSTLPGGQFGNMSGTSMATPSMTGMVTLLAQLHKREAGHRWTPDYLQVLMIHTATDVFHTGPDYRFGWGIANAKAAADLILADVAAPGQRLVRGAVRAGETAEYSLDVPAGSPELKVTMAWLDAFLNGTAERRLLNDIDLELVAPSGATKYPWTLDASSPFADAVRTKKNDLDNVEQVLVDQPEAGTWKIRVTGAGITDPDLDVQGFVLATSHNVSRALERATAQLPAGGVAVPDNDPAGATLTLTIADPRPIKSLRMHLELTHEARGDVRVELVHPDGTSSAVETEDTSTRYDLYAVYPDTRSYADDVSMLFGKPAVGTWTVRVIDTSSGSTGTVVDLMLEVELDGTTPPPANTPPVANAGKDETAEAGALVMLDGTMSLDPDGDPLTFAWAQSGGPQVALSNATVAAPTFTAPDLPTAQTLVFTLTVQDPRGGRATDDVVIAVSGNDPGQGPNQPPTARTNGDRSVKPGANVTLDASSSTDPDGDPLTFRWSRVSGPEVTLEGANSAAATFVAPEVTSPAEIAFRVEVEDGRGGIDLDDVRVTIDPDAPEQPDPPPPPPVDGPPAQQIVRNSIEGGCLCSATSEGRTGAWTSALLFALGLAGLATRRRR